MAVTVYSSGGRVAFGRLQISAELSIPTTPYIKDAPHQDDATHTGSKTGSDTSVLSSELQFMLYVLPHHTAPWVLLA